MTNASDPKEFTPQDFTVPDGFTLVEFLVFGPSATLIGARSHRCGDVVLKCWREPLLLEPDRRNFDREARLHLALSPDNNPHPNIVPFVDASPPEAPMPWIATRPGGIDLADLLSRRAPGKMEGTRLAYDILDGLATLHERGMVHGDLSTHNVLVHNGRAALCDLGLATHVSGHDHPPSGDPQSSGRRPRLWQVGTPEYMAPELIHDPARAPDSRSDVYSAAVVIGEILAGVELGDKLDHLIYTRAQSTHRRDRPPSAGEFARAMRAADPRQRSTRSKHVRGRLAVAAAGIGLAIAGLAVWTLGGDGRAPFATEEPQKIAMLGPSDGSSVISPVWVHGKAPANGAESVWILTQTGDRPYELRRSPVFIREDGTWSERVDLGWGPCDDGRIFQIIVLAQADLGSLVHAADRARDEPTAPLDKIPLDAVKVGVVAVTMTRFEGQNNICPGTTTEVESTLVPGG